ncbi:MAG: metal-dependent hydrolase [Planctomycetota bacterium]|jgi:inner membrane protein
MPSVFTHAVTGLAAGKIVTARKMPLRFWILSAILPGLPDFDVMFSFLGIPCTSFFGHRGFFHSPFLAVLLGLFATAVFFRKEKAFSKKWWLLALYFSLILASHGILDAMTYRGLGVAFFSPFSNERFLLPWQPLPSMMVGLRFFLSRWFAMILLQEILWVWIPTLAILGIVLLCRRFFRRRETAEPSRVENFE